HTEGINADAVVERSAVIASLINRGDETGKRTHERNHAQGFLRALLGNERVHEHDEDAEYADQQLGEDPNVIGGCRDHRPSTSARLCATSACNGGRGGVTVREAAGVELADCFSAALTEGSMECSHSIGATPITSAAIASGHMETRSRASRSSRWAFAGLVTLP